LSAAESMVHLGKYEDAVPVLIALLKDSYRISRVKLVYVLSLVPPEYARDAIPALLELLQAANSSDADIGTYESQVRSAEYLVRLGESEPALAALKTVSNGEKGSLTRESARSALERIRPARRQGRDRDLQMDASAGAK
jgi:thioredoxin-like negative regulator of GroEL